MLLLTSPGGPKQPYLEHNYIQRKRNGDMEAQAMTSKDQAMARVCLEQCAVCVRAREQQGGPAFWFVKSVAGSVCPYCRAYEKVYGRKAHEPAPE